MVYQVKFQSKKDAADPHSNWTDSFYIESQNTPDLKAVKLLVEKRSGGDFAEDTIEIEECPNFDADQLRKGGSLFKLN
jgi:DNA-dependent RNA polymerase auxiliary subunit epsilon